MTEIRNIVITKFNSSLNNKEAKKLENSLYNYAITKSRFEGIHRSWDNKRFKRMYISKARSLVFNLTNGVLKEKIESKKFDMEHVPSMLSWELWPEKYEEYFQKKLKKEMIQLQQSAECENMQGMFHCEKCKSNCTSCFSLQTRSADEPMTNYITCKKCGHRWKD